MPELFPDTTAFLLSAAAMAGAMFVYSTVGFGGGMVAVSLLAFVLPDLAGTVAVLMVLSFVTELSVLARGWRRADPRLLGTLVAPMALGLWLGTKLLVGGEVEALKRALGLVVAAAGVWFLIQERGRASMTGARLDGSGGERARRRVRLGIAAPVGFASGVLGGIFGTGGLPVIVLLRSYSLDKSTFRATLLGYFLLMGLLRAPLYWYDGILTADVLRAALWLSPAAAAGIFAGMAIHDRLSERRFALAVSALLVLLGLSLLVHGGR